MPVRLSHLPRRLAGAVLLFWVVTCTGLTLAAPPAQAAATATATCAAVDLTIARGTFEPRWYGGVGAAVSAKLEKKLAGRRTLSSYAVRYEASLWPASATQGQRALVAHVVRQAAACPDQVFVLAGYSQGALVVALSLGIVVDGNMITDPSTVIPAAVAPRIRAVALFGNPLRLSGLVTTGRYTPRVMDICRAGDPACQFGGTDFMAHTGYVANAESAAAFVSSRLLR